MEAKKKWKISISLEEVIVGSEKAQKSFEADANGFSDDNINIKWSPQPKEFKFELDNQGNSPITMIWEKSIFIDEYEKNHKIINSKTKLTKERKQLEPEIIPSKGKIIDTVYPWDYASLQPEIEAVKNFNTGAVTTYEKMKWVKRDIYQKKLTTNDLKREDKDMDFATYLEKTRYKIILTIKIEDKEYNYQFHFKPVEK
jgi:hypothetical protein